MKKINKTDLKKPFYARKVYDTEDLLNDLGDYTWKVIRFGDIYSEWRSDVSQKIQRVYPELKSIERSTAPYGPLRMGKVGIAYGKEKAIDVATVYTRYYATDKNSEHFIEDSVIIEDLLLEDEFELGNKGIILIELIDNFNYDWIPKLEEKFKIKFVGIE